MKNTTKKSIDSIELWLNTMAKAWYKREWENTVVISCIFKNGDRCIFNYTNDIPRAWYNGKRI